MEKLEISLKTYQLRREMSDLALEMGYYPYTPELFEDMDEFSSLPREVQKSQLATVIAGQQFQFLRPDITTMVIKSILPTISENSCAKLFYQSAIYRVQNNAVKEIPQFGIECLGHIDEICELEVLGLANRYLQKTPVMFEIGTSKFVDGIIRQSTLEKSAEKIFKKLIAIKNKAEVIKFAELHQLPTEVMDILPHLFDLRGTYDELWALVTGTSYETVVHQHLKEIQHIKTLNIPGMIDLSLTSPLTYYDGIIFKAYVAGMSQPVLSGGRYKGDTGTQAIGFSIDVESYMRVHSKEASAWQV